MTQLYSPSISHGRETGQLHGYRDVDIWANGPIPLAEVSAFGTPGRSSFVYVVGSQILRVHGSRRRNVPADWALRGSRPHRRAEQVPRQCRAERRPRRASAASCSGADHSATASQALSYACRRGRVDLYLHDALEQTHLSGDADLLSRRVCYFGGLGESPAVSPPHDDSQPRRVRKRTADVQERGLCGGSFHVVGLDDFPSERALLADEGSGLIPYQASRAEGT